MLITSKARKVVRKRKRTWPLKACSSTSVAAVPAKLKKNVQENKAKRAPQAQTVLPVPAASASEENTACQEQVSSYCVNRVSRSLEDIHYTRNLARQLVDLQLDNDSLRREVREMRKTLKEQTRQLRQEREFYEEQKWNYLQEIRSTIKTTASKNTQTKEYIESDDDDDCILASELRRVRSMFYKQRDISCRISEKFLRIRNERDHLINQMRRLEIVYSTVIDELLKHIAEVRVYFASIRKGVLLEKSAVARIVDRNAKLGYNNAILQLELLKCEKKLEAVKKRQVDFTDSFEVEKFLSKCRSNQLLSVAKGLSDDSSVKLMPKVVRTGSLINIPVAVINGNRIETKLAPLFSIVRLQSKNGKMEKRTPRDTREGHRFRLSRRKTRSVLSKVWRVKRSFETRPPAPSKQSSAPARVFPKSETNLVKHKSASERPFERAGSSEKSSEETTIFPISQNGVYQSGDGYYIYEEEGHFTPE